MRKINGNDQIIDQMITGDNEIIFNLISLIRNDINALILTDDKSYIVAQSNSSTPVWIYINDKADEVTEKELYNILFDLIEKNRNVHINVQDGAIRNVFKKLSEDKKYTFLEYMPMNVYVCHKITKVEGSGKLVMPETKYKKRMAILMQQITKDVENYDMTYKEANEIVDVFENSDFLFLWKDNDVVSMARLAHKNARYARINTVVTDRAYRGKGYAKMLVGEISERILAMGLIPMLYADARNTSSNSTYQKIGYEKVGEIMEFEVR